MNSEYIRKKRDKKTSSRSFINIIIDVILLLLLVAISSIGFVMKYIMPSGYAVRHEGVQSYASNVLGLDRHGWGNIHWILSVVFLLFLVLHIILHWKMIIAIIKKIVPNTTLRRILWLVVVVITLVLLIFPFLYLL